MDQEVGLALEIGIDYEVEGRVVLGAAGYPGYVYTQGISDVLVQLVNLRALDPLLS
jgi:hypothetical protein